MRVPMGKIVEIELIDFKGDYWRLGIPSYCTFNQKVLWVQVYEGPPSLTEPPYQYQELPLPPPTWPDDGTWTLSR